MKTLKEIFDKNNSDKGSLLHNYDVVYENKFKDFKNKPINMLEIGIFKGISIKCWLEFFKKPTIYGIDIFTRIPAEKIEVLKNENVHYCICDSITGVNEDFISMIKNVKFDFIIDDGLHTPLAQLSTFKNFYPYLKEGGSYFIEDVFPFQKMSEKDKKHKWLVKRKKKFNDKNCFKLFNTIKKYNFIEHDLRTKKYQDSYIIEILK